MGLVFKTTAPVPVTVLKSVKPASQSAAVVNVVPIQVHITVMPAGTEITKFPPDELIVKVPVLLLQMWNDQPVTNVLVTGSCTVWLAEPVKTW